MKDAKHLILVSLLLALLFLTQTKKGRGVAQYIGKKIMDISSAGLDKIAQIESFSARAYNDPPGSGKFSIGYGHQIKPGETFPASISNNEAMRLLSQDVATANAAVNRLIHVPLTQLQHDALVSFVFNVGVGAFENGTVPIKINAGNFTAAAATMRQYTRAGNVVSVALIRRRNIEASAFA